MNPESSPFRPGQPVPVELFVGRTTEIERLRSMAKASVQGRFKIGFVSGERGIGKSSLVSFVRHLVGRENDVAGCHVFLGGARDLDEMIRRTFDRLLKESMDKPWESAVKDFFGKYVRQVGLFGITLELDLKGEDLSALTHGFVPSVRQLIDKLGEQKKKALLLILDDINGLASSEDVANWLKSTVDEIATSEKETQLCILIVGLEGRRQELVARQPSLARVFDLIDIPTWSDDEVKQFYQSTFESASASVTDEGMGVLVRFTGGLPVLAHEIGDAVWREAQGPEITPDEVGDGILTAAEIVRSKLLEPQVFSAIRSGRYRSMLRKMIDPDKPLQMRFQRAQLAERLTDEEKRVLDNFLKKMRKLGVLMPDSEMHGGYHFQNRLHALCFWMEAQSAKRQSER
ncbi:MAG: ATP-binding protein [Pseudomonadota bacterium]